MMNDFCFVKLKQEKYFLIDYKAVSIYFVNLLLYKN